MIEPAVHRAAWLYYNHGMRQDEVADALSVSRATVVKYLRLARDSGAVSISVSGELFRHDVLAREIEDAFCLQAVWVVPDDTGSESEFSRVGATALLGLVASNTRMALAWGETIYSVVDHLPAADFSGVTIMQMCGNLGGNVAYLPDQCTIEMARRLNARGQNLYAPIVLSSETLAQNLLREPVIASQLAELPDCDLAVFSVGSCTSRSHIVSCGAITQGELRVAVRDGAVGVIAGRLIDSGGRQLDCSYNRRLISADLEALAAIPRRLVLVKNKEKCAGLLAVLRAGMASYLVVSRTVGREILDQFLND